ncbi:hypothetical protein D3C85_1878070 [compost metagenome]
MSDTPGEKVEGPRGGGNRGNGSRAPQGTPRNEPQPASNAAMAALFANAKQLKKK